MQFDQHYWTPYGLLVEAGFHGRCAWLAACADRMTDEATPGFVAPTDLDLGDPMPGVTQGRVKDGVYAALEGGWHHTAICRWHFRAYPEAVKSVGPCGQGPGQWANVKEVAEGLRLLAATGAALHPGVVAGLVELGMEMHCAQDQDAHRGFWGCPHRSNAASRADRKGNAKIWFLSLVQPNRLATGHSEYGALPDEFGRAWRRGGEEVNNRLVFLMSGVSLWNSLRPDLPCRATQLKDGRFWVEAVGDWRAPCTLMSLAAAPTKECFVKQVKAILRTRLGGEPKEYAPFKPDSEEWRGFCRYA